jgi:hypothetical protein
VETRKSIVWKNGMVTKDGKGQEKGWKEVQQGAETQLKKRYYFWLICNTVRKLLVKIIYDVFQNA